MSRLAALRAPSSPLGARTLRRGLALLFLAAVPSAAGGEDRTTEWRAGAYAFTDELGGFTIDGVSGTGMRDDPFVIRETLMSSSPVTLVIRARRPIQALADPKRFASGVLYMRIEARNGSGQGWVEFEFELQETLHRASIFGDGLSFDQRDASRRNVTSDSFAEFSRDFEPADKLLFRNGKVDPGQSTGFSFLITDFTPKLEFYLVQDPRIPST